MVPDNYWLARLVGNIYEDATCKHPEAANVVTGGGGALCAIQRSYNSMCGRNGKNWVTK